MAVLTELAIALGHIASSAVKGAAKAVLGNLVMLDAVDDDEDAETSTNEPLYGPLGFYARPRAPVTDSAATPAEPAGRAEFIGLRSADRVHPVGYRDLRLSKWVTPKEGGECGMVHYHGGFVSLQPNTDDDGTSIFMYAPRLVAGVPSKASTLQLVSTDGNQQITLLHEAGQLVTLTKDGDVMLIAPNGTNWVQVGDSGVVASSDKLSLAAAVMLGDKDPAGGDAIMLSTTLLTWIGEVNTALGVLAAHVHAGVTSGGVSTSAVAGVVTPAAVPVAATKVKAI